MCATINRGQDGPARLVLITGHAFGVRAFEGIFASGAFLDGRIAVSLMIGLDDSRAAATVGYQPLSRLAAEQGVEYIGTSDGRLSSLSGRIRDAGPAYLLVIGWSYLVREDIMSIPTAGCIGMHPSPLPTGRGQAPIPWTIIKGLKNTALSVFFLTADADAGPVIAQYGLDVRENETSASLFYRVGHAHFTAGLDLAEHIGGGTVTARAQDDSVATRWPRRRPADGEISETMTAAEIDALVRALLGPYPRAFAQVGGEPVAIRAVERPALDASFPESTVSSDNAVPSDTVPAEDMVPGTRIPFRCRDGLVYLLPDKSAGD
jgi:methionyl-tRNA formyltransferase